jgi:hypothetical protein
MIGVEQPVTREQHSVSPVQPYAGSRRLLDGFPDLDYASRAVS